jgi:hypothetical protein
LLPVIEGAAMLPVTVGVGYIYAALAGGLTLPIPMALVVTGSIGLLTSWYAVFQRAELCRRNAFLLGIGVLSGLITVIGLLAFSMAPIVAGRLAGTASPDARDLVAFLCGVYGAPAIVAIVEWPRIRRGIARA